MDSAMDLWDSESQSFWLRFVASHAMTVFTPDDVMYKFAIRHNFPERSHLHMENLFYDRHSVSGMFEEQERYIVEAEVIWDKRLLYIENLFSDHPPSETAVGPLIVTDDGVHELDFFKWGHSILKSLHHVAVCLSLDTIELMDNSKLRLSKELQDSYSLRCIRYLQDRDGYYEEHGYKIKDASFDAKDFHRHIRARIKEFQAAHPRYIPLPTDLQTSIESGEIDKNVINAMCNQLSNLLHPFENDSGLLELHRNVKNEDLVRGMKIQLGYPIDMFEW